MGFCMICAYVGSDLRAGVARSVGVVGRKELPWRAPRDVSRLPRNMAASFAKASLFAGVSAGSPPT